MKILLPVALVGLAISLALPTSAQQKDTVDPKIAQQIRALAMKYDEAFNKNDAAALAAFYTDDGILVTPHGTFHGRQAIETDYAKHSFREWQATNQVTKVDRVIAVGNEVRSIGKWSCNFRTHAGNADRIQGHYSSVLVREGDTWRIRKYTYSEFGTGKPGGGI
jgi:uncharacterized protein (TIGR02246 family)